MFGIMAKMGKTTQLQLRVALAEKREIQRRAKGAGVSVSAWVLGQLLPQPQLEFQQLVTDLARTGGRTASFALAALHDFLLRQQTTSFEIAANEAPKATLSPFLHTYLAAMIEHAAVRKGARVPQWVLSVGPLAEPHFASELASLRLYLLSHSPAAFRRRNLFVDSAVGSRV
jgi:hypothetical protein